MANDVFANGREISCKSGSGKSICEFPDVCFTPPENPATPPGVPVPYPNTGMSGDTDEGSRSVQISGNEIMLKNKSDFKKSTGDEAGCAAKKGIITTTNRGKVYFLAWSMDVKVEGENVVRHLDLTTHNHASPTATGAVPTAHIDTSAFASIGSCADDKRKMENACKGKEPCPGVLGLPVSEQKKQVKKAPSKRSAIFAAFAGIISGTEGGRGMKAGAAAEKEADGSKCVQKMRCYLRPYSPTKGKDGCCPGQTPHHIPPKATFKKKGGGYQSGYSVGRALCVCMEGSSQHSGSHGKNHAAIDYLAEQKGIAPGQSCNLKEYNALCAATVEAQCGCSKACIEDQLNQSFKNPENKNVKHVDTNSSGDLSEELTKDIHESAGLPSPKPTSK